MKRIWLIILLALVVVGCGSAEEPKPEPVVEGQEGEVTADNIVLTKTSVKASVELFDYMMNKGMSDPGAGYGFAAAGEDITKKIESLADDAGLTPKQLQAHYSRTFKAYMYLGLKDSMAKSGGAPAGAGAEMIKNMRANLKDNELALVEKVKGRLDTVMEKLQGKMQNR